MATAFFVIVVLHFVVALVWLGVKLSPRPEDKAQEDSENDEGA